MPRTKEGRAPNGEGSIFWDETRQRYRVRVSTPQGVRERSAKTKTEARRLRDELKRQRDSGLPVPHQDLTVKQWVQEWFAGLSGLRPNSRIAYESAIATKILPALGHRRISSLTPHHLRLWHSDMSEKGLATATIAQAHAILRKALGEAVALEILPRNVASLVSPPPIVIKRTSQTQTYTDGEVVALIDACQTEPLGAAFVIAVTMALRIGEIVAIRLADLDDDLTILRVRGQRGQHTEPNTVAPAKTKSSARDLMIPAEARMAIRRRLALRAQERRRAGDDWTETGAIFCTGRGTMIRPSNLAHSETEGLLARICERAGLRYLPPHALRGTCATLMGEAGVSATIISAYLGHAGTGVTDRYVKRTGPMQELASRSVDAILTTTRDKIRDNVALPVQIASR
ncbi:MAG: tyrosine-type recombinase/integrase [Dehalococcoidia bacterium]